MTGWHRPALLLAVHPAVDRSQRQGHLQRGCVENATAAGRRVSCSTHSATYAQVSERASPSHSSCALRLLFAISAVYVFRQMQEFWCTATQTVAHQSGSLCSWTKVPLFVREPWRDITECRYKPQKKAISQYELRVGEGRNVWNQHNRSRGGQNKSERGDSGGVQCSFQIFPSISPLPAPVIPKLPSYTDLTGPFVAHSAAWHHTTVNHRLLVPLLTLVSARTLKEWRITQLRSDYRWSEKHKITKRKWHGHEQFKNIIAVKGHTRAALHLSSWGWDLVFDVFFTFIQGSTW